MSEYVRLSWKWERTPPNKNESYYIDQIVSLTRTVGQFFAQFMHLHFLCALMTFMSFFIINFIYSDSLQSFSALFWKIVSIYVHPFLQVVISSWFQPSLSPMHKSFAWFFLDIKRPLMTWESKGRNGWVDLLLVLIDYLFSLRLLVAMQIESAGRK